MGQQHLTQWRDDYSPNQAGALDDKEKSRYIPLEIGKAIEFPISGRMGFQAISVEPYWTWWPLQISGFHPLMVSHSQRHFSLCFVGRLCHHGKAFLFAENHRASEPAPGGGGGVRLSRGWASREWLRFGFSWLQSLFSVYQGINHGFQIGLPGRQQDWVKNAEVLSLGFFHVLVIFQQENKGVWFLLYWLVTDYWRSYNSPDSVPAQIHQIYRNWGEMPQFFFPFWSA